MKKAGKVWGSTKCLFINNNFELHRFEAKKGHFCSKHKHEHKFNEFYVEKGKLKVETWKNDYDLCDVTIIEEGEQTVCKPGEYHRFTALEDTICYEYYWVELHSNDIKRETCGGTPKIDCTVEESDK